MPKKIKVPKRFAGVKLPKPLRRGLRDLVRSQNGKTVLTEALLGVAALIATHEAQPGSKTRKGLAKQLPNTSAAAALLAEAGPLQEAMRAFTDILRSRSAKATSRDADAPPIAH